MFLCLFRECVCFNFNFNQYLVSACLLLVLIESGSVADAGPGDLDGGGVGDG